MVTAAGEIKLVRAYFQCSPCEEGGFLLDERLGLQGRYSHQAQRLICLAGASWSYDLSSERLEEFCGLKVSDTTIRTIAQQRGAFANTWLRCEPEGARKFREAEGEIEFTTDGTSVNTVEGWREMKVGIFCKRPLGEPASPQEWATRTLPTPETRIAFAAIEKSDSFGRRWKAWRKRLGIPDTSAVTLLADGAKWIWEEQRKHLPHAEGVLDIFHALEHLNETGKVLHTSLEAARRWSEAGRDILLRDGLEGLEQFLQKGQSDRCEVQQESVRQLEKYLWSHGHHLNYVGRLQEGRSMGSGQVEGACKNLIGRRLKANSSRWRVRRVNRMAGLCSLMYSHQWKTYWQAP